LDTEERMLAQPLRLELLCGDVPLSLALPVDERWETLTSPVTHDLPAPLQNAMAALMTQPILDKLERLIGTRPTIDRFSGSQNVGSKTAAAPIDGPVVRIDVAMKAPPLGWSAWCCPSAAAVSLVVEGATRLAKTADRALTWLQELRLDPWAILAAASLKRCELDSLELGDLVLLNRVAAPDRHHVLPAIVSIGTSTTQCVGRAHARAAALSLTDTTVPRPLEGFMTTKENTQTRPGFSTSRIEVPVVAALPAQRLTLGEIEQWAPGTLVPLASAVDSDRVNLLVAGQVVARGRLVTLDAQLGLEIIEITTDALLDAPQRAAQ
jgi:flagellar motor switch/type III secretory pathway protein FliN